MVYMADDTIKTTLIEGQLSHITDKLDNAGNNVDNDQAIEADIKCLQIPSSDKLMDFSNFVGSVDDDNFSRPRSFSDASISSGRHGYLKKFQENLDLERKPSMKVFVRRESHIVTSTEKKKVAQVLPFRSSEQLDNKNDLSKKYQSVDNLVPKSVSIDVKDAAPPKPALPKNYRLAIQSVVDERKVKVKNFQEKNEESLPHAATRRSNHAERLDKPPDGSKIVGSRYSDSQCNAGTSRSQVIESVRHGRNSVSELPLRSTNVLYRHFDPKYQSELLRKELDKLRTKEHVRKNSVKQKLESGARLKSTGDLHVRFADEITAAERTISRTSAPGGPRQLTRQSKSVTIPSETQSCSRDRTDVNLEYKKIPEPGTVRNSESRSTEGESVVNKVVKQQVRNSELVRESRSAAILRDRGPVRSKSATIYNRTRRGAGENQEWKPLESNDQSLSKSASNLRRKQNTITRFNYDSVEQKRENVRVRFQQSDKRNRIESFSPGFDEDNKVKAENDSSRKTDVRTARTVGDNRSDEEKYAALSRQKIFHSKSSSLDSQPSQYSHTVAQSNVQGLRRQTHVNVKSKSKQILLTNAQTSSSTGDVHLDSRTRDSTNTAGRNIETDLPFSDSECCVKNGANKARYSKTVPNVGALSEPLHGKIVLRQCRVGSDVVFGLVGFQKLSIQDSDSKPNGHGYIDGQGLVTIRMIPDEQGRFGFNVKGGADQGMPIIVSRVAPNTPADNAIPRLNEGDQVLFINGRDVSQHTHEQVVVFIRQSRETRSKELNLIVRPNAYSGDDNSDEPDFVYDPETHQISSATGGANALDLSLKLLEESLESGAALAQFEQLYRKKPGMTMNIARLEANVPKNRYRDISPYDQTRVMIKNSPSGDYINANYVNMEIPVSGILNRYIAAQGPLPATCIDFWQMIWEQQSTLVVMLTTKVERGRIKCHQYWPNLYETSDHGHLQITCVKEEETASFAFREFNLTNVETQEERHISHMQYIAWPDHGVPDDPADFLDFVQKVRQKRVGLVEPSIVHCSAGIGRTGVLITMETAMCLIEANQPVYPLSIVRQMRDQRAMLIQTPNQYKFVCEAIIRCYNESIVKPLPEYQQR